MAGHAFKLIYISKLKNEMPYYIWCIKEGI